MLEVLLFTETGKYIHFKAQYAARNTDCIKKWFDNLKVIWNKLRKIWGKCKEIKGNV